MTGSIIEVSFWLPSSSVSNLVLFVEFRLYQWLRRNTVDRLTFKHVEDALDVDAEVAWQERQGVETALSHYLDDMPSMSFIQLYLRANLPS